MSDLGGPNNTLVSAEFLGELTPQGYRATAGTPHFNFLRYDDAGYNTADPVDWFKFYIPDGVSKIKIFLDAYGLGPNQGVNYSYDLRGNATLLSGPLGNIEATGSVASDYAWPGFDKNPSGYSNIWQVSAGYYYIGINMESIGLDGRANEVDYELRINLNEHLTVQPGGGGTGSGTTAPGLASEGADLLVGTATADMISLLGGNDTYRGAGGNDTARGGDGNDLIYGNLGNDLIYGNTGRDTLFGGQDNDVLFGGQGVDFVYGNLGDDVIYGNFDSDVLYGGQGDDTLYGGQGTDVLIGNLGRDMLYGGLGADYFVFGTNSGADVIFGFKQAEGDRLVNSNFNYTVSTTPNGSAMVTWAGGSSVELVGVEARHVNASFFSVLIPAF